MGQQTNTHPSPFTLCDIAQINFSKGVMTDKRADTALEFINADARIRAERRRAYKAAQIRKEGVQS